MAVATNEILKVNPEMVKTGTTIQVNIEYPGEVRDEKTGEKKPGMVTDEFKTVVTEIKSDQATGLTSFILSDRVHEFIVPQDSLSRGRFGVMNFQMTSSGPEMNHAQLERSLTQVREAIGLPAKLPRKIMDLSPVSAGFRIR